MNCHISLILLMSEFPILMDFFKKGKNSILPDTVYACHKHERKQREENSRDLPAENYY